MIEGHEVTSAWRLHAAAVELGDEDLKAWQVFGRAVVAEIGDEPAAGGGVVECADELAEALGAWVGIAHDVRNGCAGDASTHLQIACGDAWLFTIFSDDDGKVAHELSLVQFCNSARFILRGVWIWANLWRNPIIDVCPTTRTRQTHLPHLSCFCWERSRKCASRCAATIAPRRWPARP